MIGSPQNVARAWDRLDQTERACLSAIEAWTPIAQIEPASIEACQRRRNALSQVRMAQSLLEAIRLVRLLEARKLSEARAMLEQSATALDCLCGYYYVIAAPDERRGWRRDAPETLEEAVVVATELIALLDETTRRMAELPEAHQAA